MANVKVEISVKSNVAVSELYLVGSTSNLGEWNPSNALKLTYNKETNVFSATKMFPAGEEVEFKVLAAKSFDNVEKGTYGEEIENRKFTAAKGLKVEALVLNFM